MKTELVQTLTTTFEAHAQQTEGGVEYWLARDIQHLLGYDEWRNFNTAISKAKTACEVSGHRVADHFVGVNKMVDLGSGSQRQIEDIMLTRYACYLIAQNGDPRKQEIAFAQTYFAIQTRRAELIEQRLLEAERVLARRKLSVTEKELSQVIYEQTGGNEDFALIRSKGDQALFGKTTLAMKAQWKVPDNRPLADFAPTIILKAKDFATEITKPSRPQNPARTRHSPRDAACRRGCEESRAPPRLRRKEIPEEPGRLAGGGIIMTQKRPSPTHKDSLTVRSTNGAVSYQPGATPQVFAHPIYQGPTARPIPATIRCGTKRLASGMGRAFSPRFVLPSIPGALPQAGIGSHLWCWGTPAIRNLEHTIAGNVAEILED